MRWVYLNLHTFARERGEEMPQETVTSSASGAPRTCGLGCWTEKLAGALCHHLYTSF